MLCMDAGVQVSARLGLSTAWVFYANNIIENMNTEMVRRIKEFK